MNKSVMNKSVKIAGFTGTVADFRLYILAMRIWLKKMV